MATLEDEIKDLKEKNNELVQKVQYWKMTAAQRENEKLDLMRETNELRLKLSRLRNNGGQQARNLDIALQAASEKALSHLVKASAEIAKSMDIAKAYMRDRQELDNHSPRWSTLSGTPNSEKTDKIHRVPPLMMGGQSIQPVVALSRTIFNTSNPRVATRPANQNHSVTERAVPMHILQDVYIPLTRIDASTLQNNHMETDTESNEADESPAELELDNSDDRIDESQQMSDGDDYEGRRLHAVTEDLEPEDEVETPPRTRPDNPMEGPSWLLDTPADSKTERLPNGKVNLEPDSTTELGHSSQITPPNIGNPRVAATPGGLPASCEFSPTVRRRKRTSSPPPSPRPLPLAHQYSPRPSMRRNSTSGRVLKVLVAKMRLSGDEPEADAEAGAGSSPPKRGRSPSPLRVPFDAPSPNGATDSAVIVSETRSHGTSETRSEPLSRLPRRDSQPQNSTDHSEPNRLQVDTRRPSEDRLSNLERLSRIGSFESRQDSTVGSHDSRDSDSGSGGGGDTVREGRSSRRTRKVITYKEKPLNRKIRR